MARGVSIAAPISEDTSGNAEEAAAWARGHHFKSLIIVTASYHMPRSLREFHATMPQVKLIPYAVESNRINLHDWWYHANTIRALHSEYAKYLATVAMTAMASHSAA